MRFSTFATKAAIALTTLLAVAQAAPTASLTDQEAADIAEFGFSFKPSTGLEKRDDQCNDPTFEGTTTSASPYANDCLVLADNIRGDGTWTIGESNQRTLATWGSCAFGVTVWNGWIGYVGNQNIIDLINESIHQFQWQGLVGAKGIMYCAGGGGPTSASKVEWGIYHT